MTRKYHLLTHLSGNLLLLDVLFFLNSATGFVQNVAIDKNLLLRGESHLFFFFLTQSWAPMTNRDRLPGHPNHPLLQFLGPLRTLPPSRPPLLRSSKSVGGVKKYARLKPILDLSNILRSSKFLAMNLVKDSFYLPPPHPWLPPVHKRHSSQAQKIFHRQAAHIPGWPRIAPVYACGPSIIIITSPFSSQQSLFGQ